MTYSDEETLYYWAILPASQPNGGGAPGDPLAQFPQSFEKRSVPPSVKPPGDVVGPPTFVWCGQFLPDGKCARGVEGAKRYRLQVSQDPNFGTLLDEVVTDSTAYTATETYPANAALYVRVRAEDENGIGLTWSSRRFSDRLEKPDPSPADPKRDNLPRSDLLPSWTWKPISSKEKPISSMKNALEALSYDVHVELPDGSTRDFSNLLLTALTPTKLRGTGVFHWQVRAEFPKARGGRTAVGPYSRAMTFTRTIRPPSGARAVVGARSVLLSWQPKLGAEQYVVQIATGPDFGRTVEKTRTDNTSFAPDLRSDSWSRSTVFYWRVAAVDADGNSGNYTPVGTFRLHLPKSR